MLQFILLNTSEVVNKAASETAEKFNRLDPWGIAMTIIAMTVVFIALIILYVSFKYIGFIFTTDWKRRSLLKEGKIKEAEHIVNSSMGELNAAIALALYKYKQELHDLESLHLTINKVSRNYSPWSSKIYGIGQIQRN
jgi:Na+-transporting methylmalonyl-CoA/oxaloacetate decarboxylase gamma subunit